MEEPVIYAFSGLGADERVFDYLALKYTIINVKWLRPQKNEPISNYALRIFEQVDITKPFYLLGVSFGGLIAVELSKKLNPIGTILISSVEVRSDLRKVYLTVGNFGVIKYLPVFVFKLNSFFGYILFGAKNKILLREILLDTDPKFVKWAVGQLTTWKNEKRVNNCLKLNGDKDFMIPYKTNRNQLAISEGGHFMVVDRAFELSTLINDFMVK